MAKNKLELEVKALVKGVQEVLDLQRAALGVEKQGKKKVKDPTVLMRKGAKQTSGAMRALKAAIAGVGVAKIGGDFLRANSSQEAFTRGISAVVDGVEDQAQVVGFLAAETERLGINQSIARDSLLSFLAAGKDGKTEQEELQRIWSRTAESLSLLGKSQDDINGALQALTQMMSKGTVQAEELRGQLGERLPGAYNIAARAMGLTTAELSRQLQLGNVMADDLLPKFATELEKTFGVGKDRVETYSARVTRLNNEWTKLLVEIGNTGAFDAVSNSLAGLLELIKENKGSVESLFGVIGAGAEGTQALNERWFATFDILAGKLVGNQEQMQRGYDALAAAQAKLQDITQQSVTGSDEQAASLRLAQQAFDEILAATGDGEAAMSAYFQVVTTGGDEAEKTFRRLIESTQKFSIESADGTRMFAGSMADLTKAQEVLTAAAGRFYIASADGQRQVQGNIRETSAALKELGIDYAAVQAAEEAAAAAAAKRQADLLASAERVGVATRDQLNQTAETARQDFETIRLSSQFTADASAEAAQQYIDAWAAANGGILPSVQELTVAEGDLYLAILEVEKAEKRKGEAAEQANQAAKDGADEAAQANADLADAVVVVDGGAREAAAAFDFYRDSVREFGEGAVAAFDRAIAAASENTSAIRSNVDTFGQLRAIADEIREQYSRATELEDYMAGLETATRSEISALERNIDAFRDLDSSTLDRLNSQVDRLRDGLRQTAQEAQDLIDRLAEDRLRAEGNQAELDRRAEQEIANTIEQLRAQGAGADQINELNRELAALRARNAAERRANGDNGSRSSAASSSPARPSSVSPTRPAPAERVTRLVFGSGQSVTGDTDALLTELQRSRFVSVSR